MKYIAIIIITAIACFFFFSPFGKTDAGKTEKPSFGLSEKTHAAISVIKERNEQSIVDYAGKKDVILKMAENRIGELRTKLVSIKSAKRTIARKAESQNLTEEQKAKYAALISALETAETRGEEALKKSKTDLDSLRTKLEVIETEISISRSTSQIMGELNFSYSNSEIKKQIELLEQELDKANASLDVVMLEAN